MDNACPHCSVEMERIYERQHIEVPSLTSGTMSKILVRFPLMRCPICKEKFGTTETKNTIEQALAEFVTQEMQKTSSSREQQINSWMTSTRRATLLMGFCTGTFIVGGIHLFKDGRPWSATFQLVLGSMIFLGVYFGPETIIALILRILKRVK